MQAGVLHLLGAAVLALAFALVTRRRLAAMIAVARTQSVVAALAAAWQSWAEASPESWALALALLLGGAVALPWALRRAAAPIVDERADAPGAPGAPGAPKALAGAALLTVLGILAAPSLQISGMALREDVALALASVLVALLALAMRRGSLPQLIGLHALANGMALLAVVVGVPTTSAAAVIALFGFIAAGIAARPDAGGPA